MIGMSWHVLVLFGLVWQELALEIGDVEETPICSFARQSATFFQHRLCLRLAIPCGNTFKFNEMLLF